MSDTAINGRRNAGITSEQIDLLLNHEEHRRKKVLELQEERDRYRKALEKISDPRKRDHNEPDAYTTLGCVMNIALEALTPASKESE